MKTYGRATLAVFALVVGTACGDTGTGAVAEPGGDIDIEALFAPPTAAEIAAVESEWGARRPRAEDVVEESSSAFIMAGGLGTARVFSHSVDGNRHYGAVLVPAGAAPGTLPVVVVTHGGDTGVNVNDFALILALLGDRTRNFVFVLPSFRSERIIVGESVFTSGGEPSPWDRDVDDALALLDVALERVPETNPERIGVLGTSRGGTVGLLMAIRDPRIDLVTEMAGPTDFLGAWMRELVEHALEGQLRPLPGIHVLDDRFIQPMVRGQITVAEFRRELVRRSPLFWAALLPPVQVHHGTADDVVDVSQAESLINALERLDRQGFDDEFYLYVGAGHNALEMRESDARTIDFLARLRR